MRLNRFYTERQNLRINSSVKLSDSDVNHVRKVLRLKKGDNIIIFNGNEEYLAELKFVTREFVTAKLIKLQKAEEHNKDSKSLVVFQGLLRAGKFDLIIEKLTEIGVDIIVPVECEFSQTKKNAVITKIPRWNKIAISAAKQSERLSLPEVLPPVTFEDILNATDEFDLILFCTLRRQNLPESLSAENLNPDLFKGIKKVALLIGPEGGFSPKEHSTAKEKKFEFIQIGENVLRSETAAIVFSGIVKFLMDKTSE